MPLSFHSASNSGGPTKSSYMRSESQPNSSTRSSGLTTLPFDFDIFSAFPLLPTYVIIPWLKSFLNGSSNVTTPMSCKNIVKNREYKRCKTACSIPPTYKSTGNHCLPASLTKAFLSCGEAYRRKYQDDPAHCGIVSVSRFAGPPHFGHLTFTHSVIAAKGDSPVPVGWYRSTSGNRTGRSFSSTATSPHFEQCTIGIGSPQYRCREKTQSRNL